jgi:hypothetical protein
MTGKTKYKVGPFVLELSINKNSSNKNVIKMYNSKWISNHQAQNRRVDSWRIFFKYVVEFCFQIEDLHRKKV